MKACTFVLMPSTSDGESDIVLTRGPLAKMVAGHFFEAISAGNVQSTTNPGRIRYLTQERFFIPDEMMQKGGEIDLLKRI